MKYNSQMPLMTACYGYAYERCNVRNSSTKAGFSKPVMGVLACGNTIEKHRDAMRKSSTRLQPAYPSTFVPLKVRARYDVGEVVDPEDLSWSKAVSMHAREYSFDKKTASKAYDALVAKQALESLNDCIEDMKNSLVGITGLETALMTAKELIEKRVEESEVNVG